jgi:hypothetical protein
MPKGSLGPEGEASLHNEWMVSPDSLWNLDAILGLGFKATLFGNRAGFLSLSGSWGAPNDHLTPGARRKGAERRTAVTLPDA